MGVSNFTGPRESKLTIPRARKMAKHSKIPRIVNEIPGNLRANSQEKAVKLERNELLPLVVAFLSSCLNPVDACMFESRRNLHKSR